MSGVGDQKRYFRAIEETFIRLRGSPLLLSPADWRQAEEWFQRGVPLELVVRTLETVFERRAERGAAGRIHSLRYCASAVEAAWEEVETLTAPGRRLHAEALDVVARLGALARSLPDDLPDREELAAAIERLEGDSDRVEAALAALDAALIETVESRLEPGQRRRLEQELERTLAPLAGRLDETELDEARGRLRRQVLRRQRGLPLLSLFSPEAVGGPADG